MRVLLICGSYPDAQCGVGDYTFKLFQEIRGRSDFDAQVLTSLDQASRPDSDVLRLMPDWSMLSLPILVRTIRQLRPDIVHLQFPSQGYQDGILPWFVPVVSRLLGCKVVQTWHEPYSRRHALKLLLKSSAGGGLIVVRPDFKQLLHPMIRWMLVGKRYRYIGGASSVPPCALPIEEKQRLRERSLSGKQRLIVFFGFVYPHKRVEVLFDICDPGTDKIYVAGGIKDQGYGRVLEAEARRWGGDVEFAGFLSAEQVSAMLAIADAVVLPFAGGGGDWNTSIHAASQEGTFVLTTTAGPCRYDEKRNVYFAAVENIDDMRKALNRYAGRKSSLDVAINHWHRIGDDHVALYSEVA